MTSSNRLSQELVAVNRNYTLLYKAAFGTKVSDAAFLLTVDKWQLAVVYSRDDDYLSGL